MTNRVKTDLKFYSGTSGLHLPIPRYEYPEPYQDSSRLEYFSSLFNSIEINSTFYKLPMPRTVEKWALSVPEDFRFTFKLWKGVTHVKNLDFKEQDVMSFFNVISPAINRKGCVLVQFPPSLGMGHKRQLELLLQNITRANKAFKWDIAIEFRNKPWYDEDICELLEKHNAALVVHDIPKSKTPTIDHSGKVVYLRYHGPTGNYRESYAESLLAEYASYIKEWMEEGKTVYAYFNNTMGDAYNNLQTLNSFVKEL